MRALIFITTLLILSLSVQSTNIIITADEFFEEVELLAQFHGNTEIVNVSFIQINYEEAKDNSYIGFNNQNIEGANQLQLYDYSLAKKIINYLQQNQYDSITLIGDAQLIPPSYYFYNDIGQNIYDKWIPTDFFYSSPNYDLKIESSIGRIPVTTKKEANIAINKIINWQEDDKVAIAAGKITEKSLYEGELIGINTLNKGYLGDNVKKYFESDNTFKKKEVEKYLQQGGAGILYLIGHGNGDNMEFQDTRLNAKQILEYQPATNTPIIVSVLCNNGAFDTRLTNQIYAKSFGESVLASPAGGIAYLGATRFSYGVPEVKLQNGTINEIQKTYITLLIDHIFESDKPELGNKIQQGLQKFIDQNDMNDKYNLRTIFEFVLLGDPQLKLKNRQGTNNIPLLSLTKDQTSATITSNSPTNLKVINAQTNTIITTKENSEEISFNYLPNIIYLIKADNVKESRAYINLPEEKPEEIIITTTSYEKEEDTREKHDIKITKAKLSNNFLKCTRDTLLDINIENQGRRNERITIKVKSAELNIETIKEIKLEEADEYKLSYNLNFPSATQGTYNIEINVYDYQTNFDKEKISLIIEDCSTTTQITTKQNIIKEERRIHTTVTPTTQKTQQKNFFLPSIAIILLTGILAFLTMAIILKARKK